MKKKANEKENKEILKKKNIKIEKDDTKKLVKEKLNRFKKNSFRVSEVIFLVVLTSIISILVGVLISSSNNASNFQDEYIEEIADNYKYILENYYDTVDKKALVNGAISGMLDSLDDDYANLLEQKDNSTFYTNLKGSYEGIGIEIYNDEDNNIVVLGVLDDSPAQKAGIKAGDIIKQIDDTNLLDSDINILTKYVKESNSSKYKIILIRDNEEMTVELNKETVAIKSISSKLIERDEHKIGYIYISVFASETVKQFETALKGLEKQGMDSLIIDVRENSGGHLTTATSILSLLMDSKHVIYQIEKNGEKTKYYSNGEKTKQYPIVVIQNHNSASASELMSASLKESFGATIVGEASYGKGTVQEMVDLKTGDSYKFTTKKWLTPNGNWINKKGVKPDVEVSLGDDYSSNPVDENDKQLQAAIDSIINNK